MSQTQEEIITVYSQQDLEDKLISLSKNNKDVHRLTIIIPTNNRGWHSFAIWGGKIDYENPNIRLDNPISELPDIIGKFTSLEFLDISNMGLQKLNSTLVNLQKLHTLNVSFNYVNIEREMNLLSKLNSLSTLVAFSCPVTNEAITFIRDLDNKTKLLYTNTDYVREYESWFGWKSKYYQHDPRDENMIELLGKIHEYFPVGKPYANYLYSGYQTLQNIHRESAASLQNDAKKETWDYLTDRIRSEIKEKNVVNSTFMGFPSRNLLIPLEDTTANDIQESKSLNLTLSLLTNHYTIYIESKITFKKYKEYGLSPLRKKIVYGEKNTSKSELELFNMLKETIDQFYPNYKFVDHYLLMTSKIKGSIPYGEFLETDTTEFPIYSFLFGPYHFGNVEILE